MSPTRSSSTSTASTTTNSRPCTASRSPHVLRTESAQPVPVLHHDPLHRSVTQHSKELARDARSARNRPQRRLHRPGSAGPSPTPSPAPPADRDLPSDQPRTPAHRPPCAVVGQPHRSTRPPESAAPLAGQIPATVRRETSDTQSPAPRRCAQPTPPDSHIRSYNTPPTTTDHSTRNS